MTSPGTSRRLTQAEKRDTLLDAAITLFRTKGIAETTVEEITQATGVAKGTFYLYFQTKDDLIDALRVEFAQQLELFFSSARPPQGGEGWAAFLGSLVEASVDQFVDQKDLHDLMVALPHAHTDGPLATAMARAQGAIADLLDEGVRLGALDITDTPTAAWLLLDLMQAAGDRASADSLNAGRYRRAASNAVQKWLVRARA